jgi:hypothetical protein
MITYLRTGRHVRGTGNVITEYPEGIVKVKPTRENWDCILVTPAEIEAGKEKPPIQPREKPTTPSEKPKPKPKPGPVPRWRKLVNQVRELEAKHSQAYIPMLELHFICSLADELEAAQNLFQSKP